MTINLYRKTRIENDRCDCIWIKRTKRITMDERMVEKYWHVWMQDKKRYVPGGNLQLAWYRASTSRRMSVLAFYWQNTGWYLYSWEMLRGWEFFFFFKVAYDSSVIKNTKGKRFGHKWGPSSVPISLIVTFKYLFTKTCNLIIIVFFVFFFFSFAYWY